MQLTLTQGLREILLSILEDSPSEEHLTRMVRICHALAEPFVASKIAGGPKALYVVGLSPSDIAYDCIGDLFHRDDRGSLLQIKAYFASIELAEASETELLMHLRRLVFSSVNQGIYRLYRQTDPAFGKILRNIKLAVATLQNFTEIERFGEAYLIPSMTEALLDHPPFETEHLEQALAPFARKSVTIPALLSALSVILRQQKEYSRAVGLTAVAAVFRSLYFQGQAEEEPPLDPIDSTAREQLREAIARATCEAVCRTVPRYRAEQGWQEDIVAEAYTKTVEQNLVCRLLDGDGQDFSYFTGLQAFFPHLTREEYRTIHKNKLEYVGRLAYEILVAEYRKEMKE